MKKKKGSKIEIYHSKKNKLECSDADQVEEIRVSFVINKVTWNNVLTISYCEEEIST